MDELIEKFVSKKLRKKGDEYQLSANSILSGKGFGKMSKLASRLYQTMKAINPRLIRSEAYQQLVRILVAIRQGNLSLLEEGKSGYTYAHLLNGFRLNNQKGWDSLLPWSPLLSFDIADKVINVILPTDKKWMFKKFPDQAVQVGVTCYVVVADLEDQDKMPYQVATKTAIFNIFEESEERKVRKALELFPDSLILVLGTAQYYLTDKTGKNSSPSNNKSYYVTDILQTYHVQDGQVLKDYKVSKKIDFPKPIIGDIDWE